MNSQRLKVRVEERRNKRTNQVTKIELTYLPWHQAVRILDHYAPGWRYEIRSVNQIGDNLVMTVRVTIPCLEAKSGARRQRLSRFRARVLVIAP